MAERRRRRMWMRPAWWLAASQSIFVIPWVALSLRRRGYTRTVERAAASSTGARAAPSVGAPVPLEVQIVASAVTRVAGRRVGGPTCLPRAITIFWLARRSGHDLELCIGVSRPDADGLPAHAWVEYGGSPVNDTSDVRDRYHVLPMPPSTL